MALPSRLQPWHNHVMATKAKYPNKKFKEVLKIAKRTFKKSPSKSSSKSKSSHVRVNVQVKAKRRNTKRTKRRGTKRKGTKRKSRKVSYGFF